MNYRRSIIAGVIIIVVVALLRQIPVPHPMAYSAQDAASHILDAPAHKQMYNTHGYGYLSGQTGDLTEIQQRGNALPEHLHTHFYAGVGMTFNHPDPTAAITEIQQLIPDAQQGRMIKGLLATQARTHPREPAVVLALAEEIKDMLGDDFDAQRGIAMGFIEAMEDDPAAAIEVGGQYPTPVFLIIIDELGRNLSMETGWDSERYDPILAMVDTDARCALVRGYSRGGVLHHLTENTPWWTGLKSYMASVQDDCESAVQEGVAQALAYSFVHREDDLEDAIGAIPDAAFADRMRLMVATHLAPPGQGSATHTSPDLPDEPTP